MTSVSLDVPLKIPFTGDERKSVECGSACAQRDGDCECDELVTDDAVDAIAEPSTYERLVNGVVIEPASTVVMSTFSFAGTAVGTVANYFVPAGVIGPPESMPPGRFHPVPARPVFAHRN